MMETIIVDYGVGNIANVLRAFRHLGQAARVSSVAREVASASRLVLPGVGSFPAGMKGLHERELVTPLREAIRRGVPTLGICLGMQLFFDRSHEFGTTAGLGALAGEVVPFDPARVESVPHIGWAALTPVPERDGPGTLLAGLPAGTPMYFVHSYYPKPESDALVLAVAANGAFSFPAVVRHQSVWGVQFHPELSGPAGLRLIGAFARLTA